MNKKEIAIIGGTFDPVHIGHIEMAKYLINNSEIHEVWILPSYNSPHKNIDYITSYNHRVNMLKIAFKSIDNVLISKFEEKYFNSHDGAKTYTYEVLEEIKKEYKDLNINFVVGFDSIKEISTWHRYLELINNYKFLIFDRNDTEFQTTKQKKFYLDNLEKHKGICFKYKLFDYKVTNISSTSIRKMIKKRDEYQNVLKLFLDENVLKYINDNELYY